MWTSSATCTRTRSIDLAADHAVEFLELGDLIDLARRLLGDPPPSRDVGLFEDGTGIISDPGIYGSMAWLDIADGYGAYLAIEADDDIRGKNLANLLFAPIETAMGLD
jgi:hypothetical protein